MEILRDNKKYKVVDETKDDYAVLDSFDFADLPHKRQLKLWWSKEYCTPINVHNSTH